MHPIRSVFPRLVPVVATCAVAGVIALSGALAAQKPIPVADSPHLFHRADGSVEAVWVVGGAKKTKKFSKGDPIVIEGFVGLLGAGLQLKPHKITPVIYDMPKRMLVISDVEGEYDDLLRFLQANKVIDEKYKWCFGDGHLVTVGDMVDRGEKVTEVLWLMHRLSREAIAAGGHLHFILGNHEAMMMGGDLRYLHPKSREVERILGLSYDKIYGADSEVGRWLRSRNVVERVGEFVFVHAGLSAEQQVTPANLAAFNKQIRDVIGVKPEELNRRFQAAKTEGAKRNVALIYNLAWGTRGPLWYRGYFTDHATRYPREFGPPMTPAQIDASLKRLEAKTVVVGHTKVEKPTFLHGERRVLAIDTPWTDIKNVRGILVEDGHLFKVDVTGKREEFATEKR